MNDSEQSFAITSVGSKDTELLEYACSLIDVAQDYESSRTGIVYNTHGLTAEELGDALVQGDGVCLVAFDCNTPIGTLTVINDTRHNWYNKRGHSEAARIVKYVAVSPAYQGRSVASRLVQEAITISRNQVSVSTDERNEHAIHLYLKNGFIIMETTRGRLANGNAVRMAYWKLGCPWGSVTIKVRCFLSRVTCCIKALLSH